MVLEDALPPPAKVGGRPRGDRLPESNRDWEPFKGAGLFLWAKADHALLCAC